MKTALVLLLFAAIIEIGCNSEKNKTGKDHDMSTRKADTSQKSNPEQHKKTVEVSPSFTNIDPKVAGSLREIVDQYLLVKNALAADNGKKAAQAAEAMSEAMERVDKSFFTAEQKIIYDDSEETMKENAEHISKKPGDIKHQRFHFSFMSEDLYAVVRAFGGGRPLFHDHCPMAKDNEGAMWLSETKEIRNPYFGAAMPDCGTVEELIK